MSSKKLYLIFFVILFGLMQHFFIFSFLGVKPNLILVFLLTSSFFVENFLFYLGLTLISYFLLRLEVLIDWPVLVLSFLLIIAYWLRRVLPWQPFFNFSALITIVTVSFYLLISPQFVFNNTSLLIGEILFNLVLGHVFFALGNKFLENEKE